MCLIVINWQPASNQPLVMASNRDEFYRRPAIPAHYWENSPEIYGGKDLEAGGTWLAVSNKKRLAAVTNYRSPDPNSYPRTRGEIPALFLATDRSAETFSDELQNTKKDYAGFNALLFDGESLIYTSNRMKPSFIRLAPGIHGLSNHLINTPWPKVHRAKQAMMDTSLSTNHSVFTQKLIEKMENKEKAKEEELPDTGVGRELEMLLSSVFIESPNYGTRTTSIVNFVDDKIHFTEKNHTTPEQSASFTTEVLKVNT